MNTATLPPWGVLSSTIRASLENNPPAPSDWQSTAPNYGTWRNGVVSDLAALLWPIYDVSKGWLQAPSQQLIDADFELLEALHVNLAFLIKGHGSCADGSCNVSECNHRCFFEQEDDDNQDFGQAYERYDLNLAAPYRNQLPTVILDAIGQKVGTLHYQLKTLFQRPRAYQVALLQNRSFGYIWAKTGGTPSFISAHCLQGCIGVCNAFAQFGGAIGASSIDALKQFAVDIGDRRVFAGVHYPSDNLGSWYTALQLVPHVFAAPVAGSVQAFLADAIKTKSAVFAAVQAHVGQNPSSPYAATVQAINSLWKLA